MTEPTYEVGKEITAGRLYRLVPNWEGYWESERHQPSPRAFRRGAEDTGVSAYIDGPMTRDELERRFPEYAICEMSIEALRQAEMRVIYDGAADQPAHVLILGVTKSKTKLLARSLAKVIKDPGPMKEPMNPALVGDC